MNYDLMKQDERKIYELSVKEYKALWIEAYEELQQHIMDTSKKEYDRITGKVSVVISDLVPQDTIIMTNIKPMPTEEIFLKDGKPISKEY